MRKPLGEFHRNKASRSGATTYCKPCGREKGNEYYALHAERLKKRRADGLVLNPRDLDAPMAREREWMAREREWLKEQNRVTQRVLATARSRNKLHKRRTRTKAYRLDER